MSKIGRLNPEYIKELKIARDKCREHLEKHGFFVEDTSEQIGLSISLTQFGLETIYATLTQEELEYIVDNGTEI